MRAPIAVKAVVLNVHPSLAAQRYPAPLCAGAATLTVSLMADEYVAGNRAVYTKN